MRNRLALILLLSAASSLAAQTPKPDFSGTWRLNVAKSFMAGEHPYSNYELTRQIQQSGDSISITDTAIHNSVVNVPLPDLHTSMQVATDGKEHEVEIPGGFPGRPPQKSNITATWQGGTLFLRQLNPNMSNYGTQRLFLSDDGSQLIILNEQHMNFGDTEQRLVFERAP